MKGFLKEKKCDEKVRTNCIQTMIRVGLVLIQMMIVGCLTVRAELQEENMEMIEKKLEYRNLENGESFPQEIEVQVKTGQGTKGVLCHAEEQKVTGEYWLEDFPFLLLFIAIIPIITGWESFWYLFRKRSQSWRGVSLSCFGSWDFLRMPMRFWIFNGRAEPIWGRTARSAVMELEQGGVWYGIIWLHTGEPVRKQKMQSRCRK